MLVVDDNATNRRILEEMLTGWHMQPGARSTVDRGPWPRSKPRSAPASLSPGIAAIYMMPGMDGLRVAESIGRTRTDAEDDDDDHLDGEKDAAARCRELQDGGHLTKPIRRTELH